MACPTQCVNAGMVQKVMEFFACPEFLKIFNIKPEACDKILQSDFNCGFIAALAFVVFVLIVLLVIRLLLFLVFRTRRCGKVIVPSPDGNLIVTRKAIESVVRAELAEFTQITVRKLVLYRKGKKYSLALYCQFSKEGAGMPEIAQELKVRIKEVMNKLFGIDTMNEVSICIERLKDGEDDVDSDENGEFAVSEVKDVNTGI
jgi:hypothetical protein